MKNDLRPLIKMGSRGLRVLVVFSHPDDETIFLGGTITRFKNWQWHLLCVTDCDEKRNKRRRHELQRVCDIYKKAGSRVELAMLGIVKERGRLPVHKIRESVSAYVDKNGPFHIVFTHNKWGDYGHKTHKAVSSALNGLGLKNIRRFYLPYYAENSKSSLSNAVVERIELDPEAFRVKSRAIGVYLKGSQRSNLGRLKRLLNFVLSAKYEYISS